MTSGPNPEAIDIRNRIVRAHRDNESIRPLSQVFNLYVHYSEDRCAARSSIDQEVDHCNAIALFHEQKDWNVPRHVYGYTMMYTYAIFQSGRLYLVNDENMLLWNTMYGNPVGLATVCIMDESEQPSPAMLGTLTRHLDYMCERTDIPARRWNVWGHGECGAVYGGGPPFGNSTRCPGRALLSFVRDYRRAEPLPPDPPKDDPDRLRMFPLGWGLQHGFLGEYEKLESYDERLATRILGFPISPEFKAVLPTSYGSWYGTVQYFERNRMEYHPENKAPYDISYGLLGQEALVATNGWPVKADPHG